MPRARTRNRTSDSRGKVRFTDSIERMVNIAEANAKRLRAIGIHSQDELRQIGAVEAGVEVPNAGCSASGMARHQVGGQR